MPQPNSNPNHPVLPRTFFYVDIKQYWDDEWEYVPYLWPVNLKRCVAPDVPSCTLRFDTGYIKQHGRNYGAQFDPQEVRDWFVRISIQSPGSREIPIWYGRVVDEELIHDSFERRSGIEFFTCQGLEDILDTNIIKEYYIKRVIGEAEDVYIETTEAPLTFNEKDNNGPKDYNKGNRTTTAIDGIHYFSTDNELWSHRDILDYLLAHYTPDILPDWEFVLTGQLEPLEQLKDIVKLGSNCTLWKALCKLIDRKRGLGFYLLPNENNQQIEIRVYSISDFPVTVGGVTIPPNDNTVHFTIPTVAPYSHLVGDIPFRTTATNEYGTIIVRGSLITGVGSFSVDLENLDKGWWSDIEQEYKDAVGEDEEENRIFREQEKFNDVYCRFIVPKHWDGNDSQDPMLPIAYEDGTVELSADASFYRGSKRFHHALPFKKGFDYSQSPPTDNTDDDKETDFIPMACYYEDSEDTDDQEHSSDDKWHRLEKLDNDNEDLKGLSFGPLTNAFGFKVSATPNHYLAANHFDDAAEFEVAPELDWEKLEFVAAWTTDARQQLVFRAAVDNGRVKVIDVEAARFTYVVPETTVDINDEGELVPIHEDNIVLEDDLELLQAVGAMVICWYGKKRQAIEIPINQLVYACDLGAMLTSVNFMQASEPIGTVVTSIDMDFERLTTTVRTSYQELDFISLAPRSEDDDEGELI